MTCYEIVEMEFERIEFTMEDILAIHQGWISELYVQERRTEAEIVAALSKQNLIVTYVLSHLCHISSSY